MTTIAEKSQGLLDVGEHCALCNKIDFLPFKCHECEKTYCNEHRKVQDHDCVPVKTKTGSGSSSTNRITSSTRLGSTPASKQAVGAPRLAAASAASDRARNTSQPTSSSGAGSSSSSTSSTPPALERLKSLWAKKTSSSSSSGGTRPKKVNPLLALAELKKSSKGDEKIPTQNRLYFYLVRPASDTLDISGRPTTRPEKKLAVFFQKDMIVGRALDKACELLAITNKNNTSNGHRLGLYAGDVFIAYNQKLSDSIKDGMTITVR
ncbi:Cuz1p [Sugiyamaella lignohabitans]|uniref:Cuz1p n=1 Tax=Sugiyamaella lignohabitans TaxID=796027 RepID=A0A161HL59_9ASCO|nr:Cuz1p [Sugiyamaella lignohabitans]ANB12718.1 Cuz1p [Sugiyamaella lignohabitans]